MGRVLSVLREQARKVANPMLRDDREHAIQRFSSPITPGKHGDSQNPSQPEFFFFWDRMS